MGARQRAWAKRTRDRLIDTLGRRCAHCGATDKLTLDVIVPTESGGADGNGHHRRMDWSWRMSFYRRMLELGNLQVLCDSCNARKGASVPDHAPEFNWEHVGEFQPF